MRLFVAVEPDAAALAAIDAMVQRVASGWAPLDRKRWRWTRAAQRHVTLAFLGEVPVGEVAPIDVLCAVPWPVEPFALRFAGLGIFPPRGAPRALWLGMTDGATELARLQREVTGRLAGAGVPVESRAFHPHLTLARCRQRPGLRAARALLPDVGEVARCDVGRVTLFESTLRPTGAVYARRAEGALSGS